MGPAFDSDTNGKYTAAKSVDADFKLLKPIELIVNYGHAISCCMNCMVREIR